MSQLPDEVFEALVQGYFDQTLDEAQSQQLTDLLRADDRHMKRFAEVAQLQQMIASEVGYHGQAKRFNLSLSSSDSGAASAMAELARLYEDTPQMPVDFATWRQQRADEAKAQKRRSMRNRLLIGAGSVAAVLVLVGALALVFSSGGPTNTPSDIAVQQDEPTAEPKLVAELTAVNDAVWDDGPGGLAAYPAGQALHAGDRLTLVSGFATLTTNHGAMAVLEGPCTVEMLDHDNALRLHAGSMVGLVHTERAKGFVVRTPQMDVIDLGTEFGVQVTTTGTSEVHVFEGKVQAVRPQASGNEPVYQTLLAGSALQAKTGVEGFTPVLMDTSRFAAIEASQIKPTRRARDTGIAAITGQAQWSANRYLGDLSEHVPPSDEAYVFEEVTGHVLRADLPISIAGPGLHQSFLDLQPTQVIPRGTVIRSYIVIFKPGKRERGLFSKVQGSVRFDGELLGVVATQTDWRSFVSMVPGPLFSPTLEQNILVDGGSDADRVEWGADGHTLGLQFSISSGTADAVRVLVAEPGDRLD